MIVVYELVWTKVIAVTGYINLLKLNGQYMYQLL
jgi:hypothetical protein